MTTVAASAFRRTAVSAVIRWRWVWVRISSTNVSPNFCWQGLPMMSPDAAETSTQPKNESENTSSSLPPIVMGTQRVFLVTAASCGGTPVDCELKKSEVFAPLHVTSVNEDGVVTAAMSCG